MASAGDWLWQRLKPGGTGDDGVAGGDPVLVSDDLSPWQLYSLVVMMSICIGVYLCHRTAKDMGTHDHGSIVWDEFVGMWITLMALPTPGLAVGGRWLRDFPYLRYVEAVADSLV